MYRMKKLLLLIWLLCFFYSWPIYFQSEQWVHLLILFAPLVLFPLVIEMTFRELKILPRVYSIVVILFAASFFLKQGFLAGILVLPYLIYIAFLGFRLYSKYYKGLLSTPLNWSTLLKLSAWLFLVVGIAWAFANRLAFQPFEFSPIIVLLTAAHFHYAGFLIPILASLMIEKLSANAQMVLGVSILLGFPATALGITISHFGGPLIIEKLGALLMITGGLALAMFQSRYLRKQENTTLFFKICLGLSSMSLLFTMLLAMLYALRLQTYFPFLTIPWMYALHGSLNVFGVCGIAIWGWYNEVENRPKTGLFRTKV